MCGICGYGFLKTTDDKSTIGNMVESIAHRGPDNSGIYISEGIVLGHARLAIIDKSPIANQPMRSGNGRYVIVFNGEIYNFQKLKEELYQKGIEFKSNSDTEVLLEGLGLYGKEFLKKLNGVFAIAIWDNKTATLTLARDRYGVKPLYYSVKESGIVFGSEIKALYASGMIEREFNYQGMSEFLFYGNCLSGRTLNSIINNLEPGTYLEINAAGIKDGYFWRIEDLKENFSISKEQAVNDLRRILEESIERQLVADVPVGVFLSGGIDSSCITALASKHYDGKLNTYSVGFDFDLGVNELPKAKKIAQLYRTNHHEVFITAQNLPDLIEKLVDCHDQPFSDAANIPLYLLCGQIKNDISVVLQGDGGDEFFGGYRRYNLLSHTDRYKSIADMVWYLSSIFRGTRAERIRRFANFFRQKDFGRMMALMLTVETDYDSPYNILNNDFKDNLSTYNPFELYESYNELFKTLDPVQRMLWTDIRIILPDTFLEKVDKSTMAHGVEVRVPFLDNELTDLALSLPSSMKILKGEQKGLLKQALRGVVPDYVLDAKKTGFSVPYGNWLKGPLYDYFNDTIGDPHFQNLKIFGIEKVKSKMADFKSGKKDHGFLLWKVLNFAVWAKKYNLKI